MAGGTIDAHAPNLVRRYHVQLWMWLGVKFDIAPRMHDDTAILTCR